jgi:hypothetical protein
VFRPQLAKRTFDGRVGAVLVLNATTRAVEVSRTIGAGKLLPMSGEDGARLTVGND